MTTAPHIQFLLRFNDEQPLASSDVSGVRDALSKATENCRVVIEGMLGSPSPKVIGAWTPKDALRTDEIPGYTMTYRPTGHPMRSSQITLPRIHPFQRLEEWRDAVLRAVDDWASVDA
ncbi:MAG: hypothetical protein ACTS27_06620 [Phycisphaerales bacterium]